MTAALVTVAYLPFVLLPGPFFDGWAYAALFDQAAWPQVLRKFMDNGRPVAAWLNLVTLRLAGGTQAQLWFSLAGLAVAGVAWSLALWRTGLFSARLCALMGAVAVISPGNQVILAAPTVVFVLAHTFFALSLWALMEARARNGPGRWVWMAAACFLAVVSATLGEVTAVMLILLPVMGILSQLAAADDEPLKAPALLREALACSAPVVLGLAAFVLMFVLFPAVGAGFVAERRISIHPADLMVSAVSYALAVAVAYLALFAALWLLKRREPAATVHARQRRMLLALAALCAVLVAGPYIAAMRLASPAGWGVRYLQYFGCPLVFLLAACLSRRDSKARLTVSRAWFLGIAATLLLGLLVRWPLFAVRTVHTDAVMAVMARSQQLRATDIVLVSDRTAVMAGPLRDLEWTGMAQKALGRGPGIAAMADADVDASVIAGLKLRLRQRMGWAAAANTQPGPAFVRMHVRQLQDEPLMIALPRDVCRVTRLEIEAPDAAWHVRAFGWYLRAPWETSAAYSQWLVESMQGRVRIVPAAVLIPCGEPS